MNHYATEQSRLFRILHFAVQVSQREGIDIAGWIFRTYPDSRYSTLTDGELREILTHLTGAGLLGHFVRGASGWDRPTSEQREALEAVLQELGWHGTGDPRLTALARQVAGVDHVRFLTRWDLDRVLRRLRSKCRGRNAAKAKRLQRRRTSDGRKPNDYSATGVSA